MKRTAYLILVLAFFASLFSSCGEDRTYEYLEMTQENQWTFSKMKEAYLWKEAIKEPTRTTFFSNTSKFFSSLLYKDDKVSFFVDSVSAGTYGITFAVMRDPINERPSKTYALALDVAPGSPADIAGVERGTWIDAVNGTALTTAKYSILQSGPAAKVSTAYIDYDDENAKYFWVASDTLDMPASTDIEANAVYLDSIYAQRSKNIGYLVLNSFDGDDFVQQTQDILMDFDAADVDAVILDLRYCHGGSIANAASMAGCFVSEELCGTPFCHLVDNYGVVDTTYCYMPQHVNLDDKKLYIIIGAGTYGTAELFTASVNAARPMYDVLTVGAVTAGANIMTSEYASPYGFTINPATSFIATADSTLLQPAGIKPDYPINELEQIERIYPLGNGQEYLLYNIMYFIENERFPVSGNSSASIFIRKQGKAFKR